MSHPTPKLALSADFLEAYAKLPKAQQKKTRALIDKFRADPTSHAINFEHIAGMLDDKVRTVRVDQAWRAVVIQPPRGDVYVLVWVDHHDEAMAWAKRKRFEVHPQTGAFHIFEPQDTPVDVLDEDDSDSGRGALLDPTAEAQPFTEVGGDAIPDGRLFSGRTDDELLLLGVPQPLVSAVRALRTEDDLLELASYLPDEAQNGLFGLHDGLSVEEALESGGRPAPQLSQSALEPVDVENFEAAFEQPWTKQRFALVEDEDALEAILSASLELWRIFLHPSQRKLVEMKANGSARVLGGAGTGKTVVAMHRARHLALALAAAGSDERVLFTTYTRNLATDIEHNLANLCGPELANIEVVNLNRWAASFLKSQGERFSVLSHDVWAEVCEEGDLPFLTAFYRDEWVQVVQAKDITDEKSYLHTRRAGRGTRLTRKQRKAVWAVMERYRSKLLRLGKQEHADVIRRARELLEDGKQPIHSYRHVVVDETQDLRTADLRLLRALVPEGPADLFLVGDAHQRIYGHRASLGEVGINIRGRRSRRLKINYRTTEQIRDWAVALLAGVDVDDLDEGKDSLKGYRSVRSGSRPTVEHFDSAQQESAAVVDQVRAWVKGGCRPEDVCLVARTNNALTKRYEGLLNEAGIPTMVITSSAQKLGPGVRLATMHRVKGLEFRFVLIASVQAGLVPIRKDHADDLARRTHEDAEKSLLFVAATRARDELVITGYGARCPFF